MQRSRLLNWKMPFPVQYINPVAMQKAEEMLSNLLSMFDYVIVWTYKNFTIFSGDHIRNSVFVEYINLFTDGLLDPNISLLLRKDLAKYRSRHVRYSAYKCLKIGADPLLNPTANKLIDFLHEQVVISGGVMGFVWLGWSDEDICQSEIVKELLNRFHRVQFLTNEGADDFYTQMILLEVEKKMGF